MRKIDILKVIVDFLWIIAVPIGTLFIIISIPAIFLIDFRSNDFKFININLAPHSFIEKILVALQIANYLLLFYAFHLFRKTLRYFKNAKIFDNYVINTYNTIGKVLIICGLAFCLLSFGSNLLLESKVALYFGFDHYLMIVALGLFFQILSESFRIAKEAKQENDLTI